MQKGWSILFGVVLLASLLVWFIAPLLGWWLPESVSSYGGEVDALFFIILGFTAFFFVLTQVFLIWAMWRYPAREGIKAYYTHGNNRLEMVWTLVPGLILVFIAFAQIGVWERMKYISRMPTPDLTVAVLGRQWEWRMRYPADSTRFQPSESDTSAQALRQARLWAEIPEADDLHVANELHVWKGANVRVWVRTQDVLHSFSLPNLRIKQDTLPGKTIPLWFRAEKANCRFDVGSKQLVELKAPGERAWEIACQELCGGRHYAMRGKFYVHESEESFRNWLGHIRAQQTSRTVAQAN